MTATSNILNELFRRITPESMVSNNAQPTQSENNQDGQLTIWDYLNDGAYHTKHLPHIPNAKDRKNLLDEKRRRIWDFFFPLDPNRVGIDKENKINDLNKELKALITQKEIIAQEIIDIGTTMQLTAATPQSDALFLHKRKEELQSELNKFNENIEIHKKQIKELKDQVYKLCEQIPEICPGDTIEQWLDEDLARLREEGIVHCGIDQLEPIGFHDNKEEEIQVENPIVFITPAELQHPSRLPPAYIPPQYNFLQRVAQSIIGRANLSHIERLSTVIQPVPIRDQVKHLIAKQSSISEKGYRIFFGVYYIEQLMLSKDMLTKYSFFYDFITGKSTGKRILEVYYEDIVSIEHNQEYRNLPISYDDLKNTLVLEDVPTLRFSLTSGENHEISFVNQKYYDEIIRQLNEEKNISVDAKSKFIKENIKIVTDGADAAIKVLRQYLREHKGLID